MTPKTKSISSEAELKKWIQKPPIKVKDWKKVKVNIKLTKLEHCHHQDLCHICEKYQVKDVSITDTFSNGSDLRKLLSALSKNGEAKQISLDITGNRFNAKCAKVLKKLLTERRVYELALPRSVDSKLLEEILQEISDRATVLKVLRLQNCTLTEKSLECIEEILKAKRIKDELDFSCCKTPRGSPIPTLSVKSIKKFGRGKFPKVFGSRPIVRYADLQGISEDDASEINEDDADEQLLLSDSVSLSNLSITSDQSRLAKRQYNHSSRISLKSAATSGYASCSSLPSNASADQLDRGKALQFRRDSGATDADITVIRKARSQSTGIDFRDPQFETARARSTPSTSVDAIDDSLLREFDESKEILTGIEDPSSSHSAYLVIDVKMEKLSLNDAKSAFPVSETLKEQIGVPKISIEMKSTNNEEETGQRHVIRVDLKKNITNLNHSLPQSGTVAKLSIAETVSEDTDTSETNSVSDAEEEISQRDYADRTLNKQNSDEEAELESNHGDEIQEFDSTNIAEAPFLHKDDGEPSLSQDRKKPVEESKNNSQSSETKPLQEWHMLPYSDLLDTTCRKMFGATEAEGEYPLPRSGFVAEIYEEAVSEDDEIHQTGHLQCTNENSEKGSSETVAETLPANFERQNVDKDIMKPTKTAIFLTESAAISSTIGAEETLSQDDANQILNVHNNDDKREHEKKLQDESLEFGIHDLAMSFVMLIN